MIDVRSRLRRMPARGAEWVSSGGHGQRQGQALRVTEELQGNLPALYREREREEREF